ncbi:hypothetical protein Bpfe_022766, partial [Biomphalaria pfeifferi]
MTQNASMKTLRSTDKRFNFGLKCESGSSHTIGSQKITIEAASLTKEYLILKYSRNKPQQEQKETDIVVLYVEKKKRLSKTQFHWLVLATAARG